MGIPWYIFVILGLIVAGSSYLINLQALILFVFAGVIIFLWGVLKFLFARIKHKQTKKEVKEHILAGSHEIRCDNCGIKIHALFNYCPKCGRRHK